MLLSELKKLPILNPSTAKVGSYSNGRAFKTDFGMVYIYTHTDGTEFRIARKALYHLAYKGKKYIVTDKLDELNFLRVKKEFAIKQISDNTIYIEEDIFNGRSL